jgi:hypothetical protein
VEHIVPESLGNTEHVLPPGIVCDACNNYFSREVEKRFLDHISVRHLRFRQGIPNRRGYIPTVDGMLSTGEPTRLYRTPEGQIEIEMTPEYLTRTKATGFGTLFLPVPDCLPEGAIASRFLAKMAVEVLASRNLSDPAWHESLVDDPQIDEIRGHARWYSPREWPYSVRRLYEPDRVSGHDELGRPLQTIHEFDFLVTASEEWYFIFALWGTEFAINLGGPEVDGYSEWLFAHDNVSPLYFGKNSST